MKLLTHNMLTSKCLKGVTVGYPLGIVAKDIKVSEVDFNSEFIARIIPKLDWATLWKAAESLSDRFRTLQHKFILDLFLRTCEGTLKPDLVKTIIFSRLSEKMDIAPDQFAVQPHFTQLQRRSKSIECIEHDLIGHVGELPQTLIQDFETNEDFLKKVHHVLLEVEVINGDLLCPESGRKFPINDGIPNMLLNEDEV